MTRWLAGHVGLSKPYRFERTLTAFLALTLAVVTAAAALSYLLAHELVSATPRAWYFTYVAALLGLAMLCTRWPIVAALALSLAALELGLGLGSDILYRHGRSIGTLLPGNEAPDVPRRWHPLLQEVVQPGAWRPLQGSEIHYNSLGLRGPERSPGELRSKTVVALFGGSTTEDVAVPDGQSWGEQLERILGADRFAVINHGSTLYTTVQIVLKTAFYQAAFGVEPACAIYYIGGIDVQNAHLENLDPGYADFHTPMLLDAFPARRLDSAIGSISPTLRYLTRLVVLAFDTPRPAPFPAGAELREPDPRLDAIYARNIRTISAINRQRGIKTIWIGELVNPANSAGRARPGAPPTSEGAGWLLLSHLNDVLRREAKELGDVYVDVRPTEFEASDFADEEHFNVKGSLKFATRVAPAIAQDCRKRE